jgi:predicted DNA-binding transcriptional regulator AlpA
MRVARERDVVAYTRLSRSTIRRRETDVVDPFPPHFPLGPNSVGWDLDAVDQWLARRAASVTHDNTEAA